jgi:hypothetical protein
MAVLNTNILFYLFIHFIYLNVFMGHHYHRVSFKHFTFTFTPLANTVRPLGSKNITTPKLISGTKAAGKAIPGKEGSPTRGTHVGGGCGERERSSSVGNIRVTTALF